METIDAIPRIASAEPVHVPKRLGYYTLSSEERMNVVSDLLEQLMPMLKLSAVLFFGILLRPLLVDISSIVGNIIAWSAIIGATCGLLVRGITCVLLVLEVVTGRDFYSNEFMDILASKPLQQRDRTQGD